jgi:hypothetical protein
MSVTSTALILAWVFIVLLSLGFAGLARQLVVLSQQTTSASAADTRLGISNGLPSSIPHDSSLHGLIDSSSEQSTAFIFTSVECGLCVKLADDIARRPNLNTRSYFVVRGDGSWLPSEARSVTFAQSDFEKFSIVNTPVAVLADASGRVVSRDLLRGYQDLVSMLD